MADFSYSVDEKEEVSLVHLNGFIDTTTVKDFKALFSKIEKKAIILNYADISYVSSSGWGTLLSQSHRIKNSGRTLVVCAMKEGVKNIFDMMELGRFILYAENVHRASELLKIKIPYKVEVVEQEKKEISPSNAQLLESLQKLTIENPFMEMEEFLKALKERFNIRDLTISQLEDIMKKENLWTREERLAFAYNELKKQLKPL